MTDKNALRIIEQSGATSDHDKAEASLNTTISQTPQVGDE
jgi:hypothetical protein